MASNVACGAGRETSEYEFFSADQWRTTIGRHAKALSQLIEIANKDRLVLCAHPTHQKLRRSAELAGANTGKPVRTSTRDVIRECRTVLANTVAEFSSLLTPQVEVLSTLLTSQCAEHKPLTFKTFIAPLEVVMRFSCGYEKYIEGYRGGTYLAGKTIKMLPPPFIRTTPDEFWEKIGLSIVPRSSYREAFQAAIPGEFKSVSGMHIYHDPSHTELSDKKYPFGKPTPSQIFTYHETGCTYKSSSLGLCAALELPDNRGLMPIKIIDSDEKDVRLERSTGRMQAALDSAGRCFVRPPCVKGWPGNQIILTHLVDLRGPFTWGSTAYHETLAEMTAAEVSVDESLYTYSRFQLNDSAGTELPESSVIKAGTITATQTIELSLTADSDKVIIIQYNYAILLCNGSSVGKLWEACEPLERTYNDYLHQISNKAQKLERVIDAYNAAIPHLEAVRRATVDEGKRLASKRDDSVIDECPAAPVRKLKVKKSGKKAAVAEDLDLVLEEVFKEAHGGAGVSVPCKLPNGSVVVTSRDILYTFHLLLKGHYDSRKEVSWEEAIRCLKSLGFTVKPCGGSIYKFKFNGERFFLSELVQNVEVIEAKVMDEDVPLAAAGGGGGGAAATAAAVARTCHAPHAPGHDLRREPLPKALLNRLQELLEAAGFHEKAVILDKTTA